jgi:hypothetical protein
MDKPLADKGIAAALPDYDSEIFEISRCSECWSCEWLGSGREICLLCNEKYSCWTRRKK